MLRLISLLLPALFPSWRFFRQVGPSPRIEMRCDAGPWREVAPLPAVMPWPATLRRLAFSPDENERLYFVSLADRVLTDPSPFTLDELTTRVARRAQPSDIFQFRIRLVYRDQDWVEMESPLLPTRDHIA